MGVHTYWEDPRHGSSHSNYIKEENGNRKLIGQIIQKHDTARHDDTGEECYYGIIFATKDDNIKIFTLRDRDTHTEECRIVSWVPKQTAKLSVEGFWSDQLEKENLIQ